MKPTKMSKKKKKKRKEGTTYGEMVIRLCFKMSTMAS